jgi:hypothetical protein
LSGDPGSENNTQVYVSGVYQEKDTYSVSGTTLTFSTAPPTGTSNIEVVSSAPLAIGTPSDGTVTTAKLASTTGSGAVVLATNPTITTPVISSLSSASATALTLQSAGTTAITVDTSQNVGIGTSSPTQEFHLYRSSGATDLLIEQASSGNAYVHTKNTSREYAIGTRTDALVVYDVTGDTERMRIDTSGSVWFRTTGSVETWNATTGTFAKVGDATYPIGTTAPGLNVILNRNTSTGQIQEFKYNATAVGNISVTGSATAYNTASDYRLKENIAPMTGALAKVAQLKPVTYKWKVDGSDGEGFIAHELAEVCPQAVEGTKDAVDDDGKPMHQSIDTSFLVATLTAALQETKALIDTQAETINALTARIVALEQK